MLRADVTIEPLEVRMLIENHYSIRVTRLEKVRAAYRVETDQGVYAFKNARKMKDLDFIAHVVEHVKKRGFTRLPAPIPTKGGQWLVIHRDQPYYMEEWLQNVEEVSPRQHDWLRSAACALAQYHACFKRYRHHRCPSRRQEHGLWPKYLMAQWRWLSNVRTGWATPVDGMKHLSFLEYRLQLAWQSWKRAEEWRRSGNGPVSVLCHGSLHHENILTDEKKQVWLIDYERMAWDDRVRDLAQLMQYHFPRHGWPEQEMSRFLDGYHKEYPLRPSEYVALCSRLAAPPKFFRMARKVWSSSGRYTSIQRRWDDTVRTEKRKDPYLTYLYHRG
ncbi:phosphotransferase [Polycladomyces subterraneus]|uniref:Phosphotransferase n=1 Tax=Polycladomyces subterraneus TaxID=1016997 RepID=A0ABT8IMV2_9BACL|nr:phosphotransferase [Polycladomyces subterraneus]MDN4594128.1 phosphotransferase [Polycladomyces subterraneus]